jgi:hypothetical protein
VKCLATSAAKAQVGDINEHDALVVHRVGERHRLRRTVKINGRRVTVNVDAGTPSHSVTAQAIRHLHRENLMSLEPLLKSDKTTLVFEAVGEGKIRVNCQSWEDSKVILADEALQVVALGKTLHVTRTDRPVEYLNVELTGPEEAGYGPVTK